MMMTMTKTKRNKNKVKMKPTIRIEVSHDKWDAIRRQIKIMKVRHSPFHRNWKNYTVELEANENQILMLQLHGDIIIYNIGNNTCIK